MAQRKHLLLNSELARAIPAANGTRVLVTRIERPTDTSKALSDCIRISPDGSTSVFRRAADRKPNPKTPLLNKRTGYDEVDLANRLDAVRHKRTAADMEAVGGNYD